MIDSNEYEDCAKEAAHEGQASDEEIGSHLVPSTTFMSFNSAASVKRARFTSETESPYTIHTSHFTEVIELAKQVNALLDLSEESESLMNGITIDTLRNWISEAQRSLGLDIVYDDEVLASLELKDFTKSDCERFDNALSEEGGLDKILTEMKSKLCLRGQSPKQLRSTLKGTSNMHGTIDVLQNGARRVMVKDFKPNGGRETTTGSSYLKKRAICNHAIRKLYDKGHVAIFSYDALQRHQLMREIHTSPLVWAEKSDPDRRKSALGRTCLHASKGSKLFESYNDMT